MAKEEEEVVEAVVLLLSLSVGDVVLVVHEVYIDSLYEVVDMGSYDALVEDMEDDLLL